MSPRALVARAMMTLRRGQRDSKSVADANHQQLYQPCHHRLYCEPASCDCPPADDSAYTAAPPCDLTSYRTCYARWPEVDAAHAHAHDAGTGSVLTLRCLDEAGVDDVSGQCAACHVVDKLDTTQLDLLRHDVATASASSAI